MKRIQKNLTASCTSQWPPCYVTKTSSLLTKLDTKSTFSVLNGKEPTDLIPLSSEASFCDLDSEGRLLISVANVGQDNAGISTARVQFSESTVVVVEVLTPALPKGFTYSLDPIDIPPEIRFDFTITITVDVNGEVAESDETNNLVDGFCIG